MRARFAFWAAITACIVVGTRAAPTPDAFVQQFVRSNVTDVYDPDGALGDTLPRVRHFINFIIGSRYEYGTYRHRAALIVAESLATTKRNPARGIARDVARTFSSPHPTLVFAVSSSPPGASCALVHGGSLRTLTWLYTSAACEMSFWWFVVHPRRAWPIEEAVRQTMNVCSAARAQVFVRELPYVVWCVAAGCVTLRAYFGDGRMGISAACVLGMLAGTHIALLWRYL